MSRRSLLARSLNVAAASFAVRTLWSIRHPAAAAAAMPAEAGMPLAFLSNSTVAQGEAFSVHVNGRYAVSATATFNQRRYPLYPAGDYSIALLGAGQLATDQIEIDPADYRVSLAAQTAAGAPPQFELGIGVTPTAFPVDALVLSPEVSTLLAPNLVDRELAQLKTSYTPADATQRWLGLFQWPVIGPITTRFGQARSYNGGPVSGHHSGVDIGVDLGTPVAAAAAGKVTFAGMLSERGNMVIIEHGLGVFTGYAHLSAFVAGRGDTVQAGTIIGLAGSTGLSTGPHVHWECAVNGVNVDASQWTRVLFP